ncbi:arginine--tRNA ligase [Acidimicrobiaceae bacterium]|nr:arginine--tRNA ligase [Acidimicrobiaceae bacterium]
MYQLIKLIKNLENELQKLVGTESISLRISNNPNYDFQINNLVKFQNHKKIKNIKNSFYKIIDKESSIKKFEITDNYFINLEINIETFTHNFDKIRNNIKVENPQTVLLDYGGPNIGKPLHVGHLRSLNIGRSLYQIHKLAGHNVLSDIHMGDWGMPIAQIISYIDQKKIDIDNINIDSLEKIYPEASNLYLKDNKFKELAQANNKMLNENNPKIIKKWKKLREVSIESIKDTFQVLNQQFDLWIGESDVNNLIPGMIKKLKEDGKISLDDGAYVSNFISEPKILITKSDGSYLYLTTDLATVLNRTKQNKVDKTLYIVDKRQKLHFEQLIKSIKYFELSDKEYQHIAFGTVNDSNGNPYKTREGDAKKLIDLFKETSLKIRQINRDLDDDTNNLLANTVLTFSDLKTNRMTDYKFDLDKFTNISGKTGIYVQYALVRAKKLLNNASINTSTLDLNIPDFDESDLNLTRELIKFEYFFSLSLENNEPHHLANYLYELSNLFNSMYQNENILENKNEIVKFNKLKITEYFIAYSSLLMECLGLEPVEEM